MVLNCGFGQDSWESLGLQGDPPSYPKGNQTWIFIGRIDAEIEPPILWPTDVKKGLIRKDPVTGKDWRQEEKRRTEDEMVGWNHQLDGHEFAQAPGVGEEQQTLVCCSPWGCRVRHDSATELNWTYHISNTICNWHVFPARLGLPRPQQISPIKFVPMHRSQCLAFTRHSVSSDCRRTSILVDIKE